MRLRARVVAAVGAAVLALGQPGVQPDAAAVPLFGYDVSWPQCATSDGGYGLPMPPATAQFVIIGLTKGLPFTDNPCLASQVAWAQGSGVPTQAYTMAAFPTADQLSRYASAGPWSSSSRVGQLSNVGYAEAQAAVATMERIGFRPPTVWIDVEPRPAQPWPTATAVQQRENRAVLAGMMRGLREAGYSYGFYSYTSGWQSITGGWRLPGIPVWATAGRLDYPSEALDRCRQPSFSGGPVLLSQWYDDTRDYDLTCDPYQFTRIPMPASTLPAPTSDLNGDWTADVLVRSPTGDLILYGGNGTAGWSPPWVGTGFGVFDAIVGPGDFTGDGAADVLARSASTGQLWLYPGNGRSGWLAPRVVGTGFGVFDAIVGPGDFTGDGAADVLARSASTGQLWLYPGDGAGGWLPWRLVGSGWGGFDAVM